MNNKNFKSKSAFLKWNAYGHIHTKTGLLVSGNSGRKSVFSSTPGNQNIKIRGKTLMVNHAK